VRFPYYKNQTGKTDGRSIGVILLVENDFTTVLKMGARCRGASRGLSNLPLSLPLTSPPKVTFSAGYPCPIMGPRTFGEEAISLYPNKQPNSDFCFVCGRNNPRGLYMTFYDDGRNEIHADYTVPDVYQSYPGIVHGGIVAAILDETVGRVAFIDDHHHFMMSVKLEVKYRQPVPTETPLIIRGQIVKLRGRLGKAIGQILLPDNTIAAESELTLADVPAALLENANMEALGWYIDP